MPTIEELASQVERLARRVEECESVLQLQDLKARYGETVDQRYSKQGVVGPHDLERIANEVAALFTTDGVWDGGPALGVAVGRAAIAERLRSPTLSFSRHFFLKPRIHVNGERASARWDLLSPCRNAEGRSYWMCGYEDDEYLRVDGIWLHQSMKLTTIFMAPVEEGWSKILA
jgi:hypothetical protein